jgi:hypothetical protein
MIAAALLLDNNSLVALAEATIESAFHVYKNVLQVPVVHDERFVEGRLSAASGVLAHVDLGGLRHRPVELHDAGDGGDIGSVVFHGLLDRDSGSFIGILGLTGDKESSEKNCDDP